MIFIRGANRSAGDRKPVRMEMLEWVGWEGFRRGGKGRWRLADRDKGFDAVRLMKGDGQTQEAGSDVEDGLELGFGEDKFLWSGG